MVAAAFADQKFGALTANLKKTQLATQRSLWTFLDFKQINWL
jgi:hypothetical protein